MFLFLYAFNLKVKWYERLIIKLFVFRYVKNIFGDTKDVADWDNGGIQERKTFQKIDCLVFEDPLQN